MGKGKGTGPGLPKGYYGKAREAAKAEYDKRPEPCTGPECKNPIPYGKYIKGHKTCSKLCANRRGALTRRSIVRR